MPVDVEETEAVTDDRDGVDGAEQATDPTRFELPAQADIRVAAEVQARCLEALEAGGDVTIGCGDVERLDAAVLQCIGALGHGLRQGGRSLVLTDRTAAVTRAIEVLGFGPLLDGSDDDDEGVVDDAA